VITEVAKDRKGLATDQINALVREMEMAKLPQVECPVTHHFGPSIYIREVVMPAGAVIVGKPHKTEHLCNMIEGRMIVVGEDGVRVEVVAPAVFMAKKGRKIAYIIEAVRFQNIFSTDETNVEKLENMLVENLPLLLEEEK
jgi:hypothetical protein